MKIPSSCDVMSMYAVSNIWNKHFKNIENVTIRKFNVLEVKCGIYFVLGTRENIKKPVTRVKEIPYPYST